MRIQTYEKTVVETLHVSGVDVELAAKFEAYCKAQKAPKSFFMNQMLGEFLKSTEKTAKPKATRKAAGA